MLSARIPIDRDAKMNGRRPQADLRVVANGTDCPGSSALDERIAKYLPLYKDVSSVIWVLYSDLVLATHTEQADEALLELLRDPKVIRGFIDAIRARAERLEPAESV
jgi:hypothetical protein